MGVVELIQLIFLTRLFAFRCKSLRFRLLKFDIYPQVSGSGAPAVLLRGRDILRTESAIQVPRQQLPHLREILS